MTVYYSVRISKRLLCSCDAYKFPHDVSKRLCSVSIPDCDRVPVRVTPTSLKRAKDLILNGYL